jgi:hypothetical protein
VPPAIGGYGIVYRGVAAAARVANNSRWCFAAAADKFFPKEVAQNRPPHFRQDLLTARNRFRPISGDGAWMNFRFSRALPRGVRSRPP